MNRFCNILTELKSTGSSIQKTKILTTYFHTLPTSDLIIILNILLNKYVTHIGPKQLSISNQSTLDHEDITIQTFHNKLLDLTQSRTENKLILSYLFNNIHPNNREYIKKILLNKLSVGVSDRIALSALSLYLGKDITQQYYCCNDIDLIISNKYIGVTPFKFVSSMLAKSQPPDKYPINYAVEFKYDGFRFQFHKENDSHIIYSRSGEDVTNQCGNTVNELASLVTHLGAVILDGELIAPGMNFQDAMKKNTPLIPIIFDILYIHDIDLLNTPTSQRRNILEREVDNNYLSKIKYNTDINVMFTEAIREGFEGIMIKDLDQSYLPNERKWIKMKKHTDSIDLVIMGAERGEGKRNGLYGSFILGGIFNNAITPFCKVGTGFSDKQLKSLYTSLSNHETIDSNGLIWFEGKDIIIEVNFFEITDSPTYKPGKSLRFPVFKRIRPDKNINQIQDLNDLPQKT